MAKGDAQRLKNTIGEENQYLQNRGENLRFGAIEPEFNYNVQQRNDANLMDRGDYAGLMGGFKNFAETGGFSPEDISDFRARAAAPIRAGYQNALREVDRARAINGGNMPGYAVLRARMARDQNQGMSDATINANAAIAQMVQQGKMAGLQGGTSLYGTTPARSNMFGNQVNQSVNNALALHGQDIDRAKLRLGALAGASGGSRLQSITSGIGQFVKDVGEGVAGAAAPWGA